MDSRDGRVVRFEDGVDMGTFDVCALDNTKENEDETRNPRSISTRELMRVPMAELTLEHFL